MILPEMTTNFFNLHFHMVMYGMVWPPLLLLINGFYYSARYPGDDSVMIDKQDLEQCKEAIDRCREFTGQVIIDRERLHSEDKLQEFLDSEIVPEELKEQILKESWHEIVWECVPNIVYEEIQKRFSALKNLKNLKRKND